MQQNPSAKYMWEKLNYLTALPPKSEILLASSLSEDYIIMLASSPQELFSVRNNPNTRVEYSFWLLDTSKLNVLCLKKQIQEPLDFSSETAFVDMLCEGTTLLVLATTPKPPSLFQANSSTNPPLYSLWKFTLSQDYKTILTEGKIMSLSLSSISPIQQGSFVLYNQKLYLQDYPAKTPPTAQIMVKEQKSGTPVHQQRVLTVDISTGTISSNQFSPINTPRERTLFNIARCNNKMFLFGGFQDNSTLSDMWALNLDNLAWKEVSPKMAPFLKHQSTPFLKPHGESCAIGNKIYLLVSQGSYCFDLFCYDSESNNWHYIGYIEQKEKEEGPDFELALGKKQLIPAKGKLFKFYGNKILFITLDKEGQQYMVGADPSLMQRNLFNERLFSDVKFKVQGEVISAHKGVLSAVSPYFKNMFTSGMIDANNDIIEMPNTKVEVFKALLEYIYCNTVLMTEDIAWDLLEESEKVCIPELKKICERFILGILNTENVIHTLRLANILEDIDLKNACLKYAYQNIKGPSNTGA